MQLSHGLLLADLIIECCIAVSFISVADVVMEEGTSQTLSVSTYYKSLTFS